MPFSKSKAPPSSTASVNSDKSSRSGKSSKSGTGTWSIWSGRSGMDNSSNKHNRNNKSKIKRTTSGPGAMTIGLGAPKPMPMAIMRNAHEVIRGAMKDIQELVEAGDFEKASALWHRFHRFSDLHMNMEEGRKSCEAKGLFHIIDEHAEQAAKKAGLRHHHSNLYELEDDVVDIFTKAPDINRAKEVYPIFLEENEAHLKEEEGILMPAIQAMQQSGVPLKKYIKSDILPVLLDKEGDMEFFIKFANEILERHDTVKGLPRVRVFNHALWALASKSEWAQWDAWIKETLSEEKYNETQTAIREFKEEQAEKKQAKAEKEAKEAAEQAKLSTEDAKVGPARGLVRRLFTVSGTAA